MLPSFWGILCLAFEVTPPAFLSSQCFAVVFVRQTRRISYPSKLSVHGQKSGFFPGVLVLSSQWWSTLVALFRLNVGQAARFKVSLKQDAVMQTCSNIQNWWNHIQRYWIQFCPLVPTCPSSSSTAKERYRHSYHSSEWPALTNPALSRRIGLGDLHRTCPSSAGSQVCDSVIFSRSLSDLLFLWVMLKELHVGIFPQYFQASHHIEEKSVFIYLQLREETGSVTVIGHKWRINWTIEKRKK